MSVKMKLQQIQDIPLHQQELVFDGKCLREDHTLAYYHIRPESIVHLLHRRENPMEIFINIHSSGKIISLTVHSTDKISSVKEMIHDRAGIPSDSQLLLYDDELLKDAHTLCGHSVKADSIIDLVTKGTIRMGGSTGENVEMEKVANLQKKQIDSLRKEISDMSIRLKIDDIHEVVTLTANTLCQWEEFGVSLGVSVQQLKQLSAKHPFVSRCHYEVLRYWITKLGGSWEGLVAALKHPLVKQVELANEIDKKHLQGIASNNSNMKVLLVESSSLLNEDDNLSEIFDEVDWRVLGMLLGLNDSTLEDIANSCSSDNQCQQLMINHWINTGQAYWSVLIDTLKHPVIGAVRLAKKLAKIHLNRNVDDEEIIIDGTLPVDDEEAAKMKLVIDNVLSSAPEKLGAQPKGIVFVIGMAAEVTGVEVDVENVRKTFHNELQFAVHRVENPTSSQLVALIEAAATYKYPIRCKHKCFYFAGHGGIDRNQRPFFKPVCVDPHNEVFLIRENILDRFKHTRPQDQFVFLFDCCLSFLPSDDSSSSVEKFTLESPLRCLVAYATHKGLKAYGDSEEGGRWTASLCKNITEQAELGELLAKAHKDVLEKSNGAQVPQFHSCVGPIYLKGMPDRYIVQPQPSKTQESQNVLKRFHADLLESLYLHEVAMTSLASFLSVDCVLSKATVQEVHRKRGSKAACSILLNALESEVDAHPEALGIIFQRMKYFEELRGLVMMMKGESEKDTEDTDTFDVLSKALESSRKRETELKAKIVEYEKRESELQSTRKMQVYVESLDGKMLTFDVLARNSIRDLKSLIHDKEDIRPEQQQLFLNDQRLQDEYSLSHYNITDGNKILLISYALIYMRIFVFNNSGHQWLSNFALEMESCDTIEMVKLKIANKTGIPAAYQVLHFQPAGYPFYDRGIILKDYSTLKDNNVQNENIIFCDFKYD